MTGSRSLVLELKSHSSFLFLKDYTENNCNFYLIPKELIFLKKYLNFSWIKGSAKSSSSGGSLYNNNGLSLLYLFLCHRRCISTQQPVEHECVSSCKSFMMLSQRTNKVATNGHRLLLLVQHLEPDPTVVRFIF